MNTKPRRISVWKVIGFFLGVVAFIAAITFLWIDSVAKRRRAQMEQQVHQLHAEVMARDGSRPALRGEPVPGNAWEDYGQALAEVGKLSGKDNSVIEDCFEERPKADRAEVQALIVAHGAVFDHLRRGTRRTHGAYPYAWEEGMALRTPERSTALCLSKLASCRARLLSKQGDVLEAARSMLDLLQFGRDMASNGTRRTKADSFLLISTSIIELKDLIDSPGLTREDLAALGQEMERIDRHFPGFASTLANDVLCLGFELLKPEEKRTQEIWVPLRSYWRFAFSRRVVEADAYQRLISAARKVASIQGKSRTEEEEFLKALPYEVCFPGNPFIERCWISDTHAGLSARCDQSLLRLLRVAAHYRATGEVLDLDDPFGGKLHHSVSEGRLRVWTLWLNGVDDQGDDQGVGWSNKRPMPVPGKPTPYARDIVLEVRK